MNRKLLFSVFLFVAANVFGASATLTVCDLGSVQQAVDNANDNEVVTLPSGCTSTWTGTLTITKAIWLKGATTTDVPHGGNFASTNPNTFQDKTTIINAGGSAIIINTGSESVDPTVNRNRAFRISNITINKTGVGAAQSIVANGVSQKVRIDHCHLVNTAPGVQAEVIGINGGVYQ